MIVAFGITLGVLFFGWYLLNGKTAVTELKQKIKQDKTTAEKMNNED